MRKLILFFLFCVCSFAVKAQYKKASFLNKEGRTHEVGVHGHFLAGATGPMTGIQYSYGRDKGNRYFYWIDLEFVLPSTFKYTTVDFFDPNIPVTVSGKISMGFIYRYNAAYFLTKSEDKEVKSFRPFVTAGANLYLVGFRAAGYDFDVDPPVNTPKQFPEDLTYNAGLNGGAGFIYNFSEKIGVKLAGGYNFQFNLGKSGSSDVENIVLFGNHPYAALSVRFMMPDRD